MIPKTLHFIWVGDDSKRPDNCIESWIKKHHDWQIKLWGNEDLVGENWRNKQHMQAMFGRELNGVADMMRWEILLNEGGIVIDADSFCLRALDEGFLQHEAFACWESEIARPGLIAAGYFGSEPGTPFLRQIVEDIHNEVSVIDDLAWRTVGPLRLTDSYRRYQYQNLHIYPSHFFIPKHFSGLQYRGNGAIYATQLWGSTLALYDRLHSETIDSQNLSPQPAPRLPSPSSLALRQPIATKHDSYFVQQIKISDDVSHLSRIDVFQKLCSGQRVLHIGCADWPITEPKASLHLALEAHCASLDGFDIHEEALRALSPYTRGNLYSRFEDINKEYDLVLVPEVLEHVSDIASFFKQLDAINSGCLLISVPDAFQCANAHFEYDKDTATFTEIVHPDHNCWYSPFTLKNVICKHTDWKIEGMWFFNRISLLAMATKEKKPRTKDI